MLKNIAVVLRGHYRTWGYVHPAVFDFYDGIAENVDYYISTWKNLDHPSKFFTDPFVKFKKNLVHFLQVYPDETYYTSYLGASYLSYQIIPYMLSLHHINKYEFVFNTRPDIIYRMRPNAPKLNLKEDTYYTTNYVCQPDGKNEKYHIGVEDHFFISSFENNLIMNTRHCELDPMGCHNQILNFATQYGIKTAALHNLQAGIVRPTAFNQCPNSLKYFDSNSNPSMKWFEIEKKEKLKLLRKYSIPEKDYTTTSIQAKL